jgi:flagellar hook-basal body complex protein FliE
MPAPISSITGIAPIAVPSTQPAAAGKPGDFQSVLTGAINSVENAHQDANRAAERFLSGEGEELHSVILATQRAELQLELGLQVRNKVVEAYQEIMRMQI